jgi:hypothetical protein
MSSFSSHRKRPQPERFGPARSAMATLRPPRTSGTPQDVVSVAGAAVCGMLENGVRTAYAVIDEYLLRGQEAARGLSNDLNRRGSMNDVRGNVASGYGPIGGYGLGNPMAMMTQWMAFLQAWNMQAWNQFWFSMVQCPGQQQYGTPGQQQYGTPGQQQYGTPGQQYGTPGPQYATPGQQQSGAYQPHAATAPDGQPLDITVNLTSNRPVTCTAHLSSGTYPQGVVCERLVSKESAAAATPIEPPSINWQPGKLQVNVTVSPDQPLATYTGHVLRQPDLSTVGDVTVHVGP